MQFRLHIAALLLSATALSAQSDEHRNWLRTHPVGEPLDAQELRFVDADEYIGLPPPTVGMRYAVIDEMVVELDPETYELLQVLRSIAAVAPVAGADEVGAESVDVPRGHYPPPGSCRVWFPDRPPGQQPTPGSCDVQVPPGAVLVGR